MRLFSKADIDLLGVIDPEGSGDLEDALDPPEPRYKARLCDTGRLVVLRNYSRPDDKFREAVEAAKSIWYVRFTSQRSGLKGRL